MWMFKNPPSAVKDNVKLGPIQIDTNELECIIKTAHTKAKAQETRNDNLSKHANIINLSKAFIKTVTKNPNYNEDQYILNIEVKEKKPIRTDTDDKSHNLLSKIIKRRARRDYKVIDATIDPKLFSHELINSNFGEKKRIKTLRLICLAIITENRSWKNTLYSLISYKTQEKCANSEDIDIREVIIEWEEESDGHGSKKHKTRKRYKTHLSKNPNANYKDCGLHLFNLSKNNNDCFKIEVNPKSCSKCDLSQNKHHLKNNSKCKDDHVKHCSGCNEEISGDSKQQENGCNNEQNNTPEKENQSQARLPTETNENRENNCGNYQDPSLSTEIKQIKHKVLEIIESIATSTKADKDLGDKCSLLYGVNGLVLNKYPQQCNYCQTFNMLVSQDAHPLFTYTEVTEDESTAPFNNKERNITVTLSKNCHSKTSDNQKAKVTNYEKHTSSESLYGTNYQKVQKEDKSIENESTDLIQRKHGKKRSNLTKLKNRFFRRDRRTDKKHENIRGVSSLEIESQSTRQIYDIFCKQCKKSEEDKMEIKYIDETDVSKGTGLRKIRESYLPDNVPEQNPHGSSETLQLQHDSGKLLETLKSKLDPDELESMKLVLKENSYHLLELLQTCSQKNEQNLTKITCKNEQPKVLSSQNPLELRNSQENNRASPCQNKPSRKPNITTKLETVETNKNNAGLATKISNEVTNSDNSVAKTDANQKDCPPEKGKFLNKLFGKKMISTIFGSTKSLEDKKSSVIIPRWAQCDMEHDRPKGETSWQKNVTKKKPTAVEPSQDKTIDTKKEIETIREFNIVSKAVGSLNKQSVMVNNKRTKGKFTESGNPKSTNPRRDDFHVIIPKSNFKDNNYHGKTYTSYNSHANVHENHSNEETTSTIETRPRRYPKKKTPFSMPRQQPNTNHATNYYQRTKPTKLESKYKNSRHRNGLNRKSDRKMKNWNHPLQRNSSRPSNLFMKKESSNLSRRNTSNMNLKRCYPYENLKGL